MFELDSIILESEYNVIMALMNSYEKEYMMECYYMEADSNQMATSFARGVSNVGQKIDQGFNNAIQKGNAAVDKFGQSINNATNNIPQTNSTNTLANKIENGINKLIGWCKKATGFITKNSNTLPPKQPINAPPQAPQLKNATAEYTKINQEVVQCVSQSSSMSRQQLEQQVNTLTAKLAELEKKVKYLQIKQAVSQSQQTQNTLPPLKRVQPTQQQRPTQPIQQPQPSQPIQNTQPIQQPTQNTMSSTTVTQPLYPKDLNQMSAALQDANSKLENAFKQMNQNAANVQNSVNPNNQIVNRLIESSVKTNATISNDVVQVTKNAIQSNNNQGSTMAQQMFRLVNTLRNSSQARYMDFDQSAKRFINASPGSNYIAHNNFVYPNQVDRFKTLYLNPNAFVNPSGVRVVEPTTVVIPAEINNNGNVIRPGQIGSTK